MYTNTLECNSQCKCPVLSGNMARAYALPFSGRASVIIASGSGCVIVRSPHTIEQEVIRHPGYPEYFLT